MFNKPIMRLANVEKSDLIDKKGGNMKNLLHQILMLGGIYFIISFMLSFTENIIVDMLYAGALVIFIILFIILCFKKGFVFLNKIDENYKKTTNYLVALGYVEYFSIIFGFIPSIIYGYNAAMAQYEGVEYSSWLSVYRIYLPFITLGLIIIALLWATYKSFIKKNN